MHTLGYLAQRVLDGEVARCQPMHFGLGHYSGSTLTAKIKWPGTSIWDERSVSKNSINEISQ